MTVSQYTFKTLKQYADEHGTTVRSSSDLSPLESWLLRRLYYSTHTPNESPDEYLDRLTEQAAPDWEGIDADKYMNELRKEDS